MTRTEINLQLHRRPFAPFDIVASSGGRYRVVHPEMAIITAHGAVYVFAATGESDPDVVSLLHVAALEPVRAESAVHSRS